MEYSLSNPSIDKIIDYCNDLLSDEYLIIYDFGINGDLVLHIYKDEEFNPLRDKDYSNLVDIHTYQNGEVVDDAVNIYVTDGELYRELKRISEYRDFGTL